MNVRLRLAAVMMGSLAMACTANTEPVGDSESAVTETAFDWNAAVASYANKDAPPISVQSVLAKYDAPGEYVPSTGLIVAGSVLPGDGTARAADFGSLSPKGALRCRAMVLHGEPGRATHAVTAASGTSEKMNDFVHVSASLEVDTGAVSLVVECYRNVAPGTAGAKPITFQQIVDALRDAKRGGAQLAFSDATGVRGASK